jgi:hypothetical protein
MSESEPGTICQRCNRPKSEHQTLMAWCPAKTTFKAAPAQPAGELRQAIAEQPSTFGIAYSQDKTPFQGLKRTAVQPAGELLEAAQDVIAWEESYRTLNHLGKLPPQPFRRLLAALGREK